MATSLCKLTIKNFHPDSRKQLCKFVGQHFKTTQLIWMSNYNCWLLNTCFFFIFRWLTGIIILIGCILFYPIFHNNCPLWYRWPFLIFEALFLFNQIFAVIQCGLLFTFLGSFGCMITKIHLTELHALLGKIVQNVQQKRYCLAILINPCSFKMFWTVSIRLHLMQKT